MLEHAERAVRATQGRGRVALEEDDLVALGMVKLIEIIDEAANRVSVDRRNAHPEIPWTQIVGTRHRLVHGYDQIDYDVVWRIIQDELPPLITQLNRILAGLSDSGS